MARRFFYSSFALLCLTAAYQLGVERARAEWDSGAPGQIVGTEGGYFYLANGEAWIIGSGPAFERAPERDLPVSTSDIKFLDSGYLVTIDDEVWVFGSTEWELFVRFPGGPIAVEQNSAGSVKGKYR